MRPGKTAYIIPIVLVLVLSMTTIWSTVPSLFLTQLAFIVAGIIIVYIFSKSDIKLLFSISPALYIISILLLILTMIIGKNIRGSVRWIDLGFFNLQTSELIKPFLAIAYAQYLSENKIKNYPQLLKFLLFAAIPVIMVAVQPDLGSALSLMSIPVILLIFSGQMFRMIILGIILVALLVPLESKLLKPYQRERIETFVNPYVDPKGAGYNVIQATIAVGSGGVIGKGVKLGTQSHLNFLPERHTDFIFASYAEEFGMLGISVLFAAYYGIMNFSLTIVKSIRDSAPMLLSLAFFAVFLFQGLVNIGMNLGIMPVTGITLPLFSYGGSSLLSFAIIIGLQLRLLDLITPFEI